MNLKHMLIKEDRLKECMYIVCFRLYEVLKQATQIHADRNQKFFEGEGSNLPKEECSRKGNGVYRCVIFLGGGNVLPFFFF